MYSDMLTTAAPVLLKLLTAGALGGLIGYEREAHGQAAGFRTNILVAMGACLMMMLSMHMEEAYRHLSSDSTVRLDPGRIASYAIASMGFLGAGAIIKGQGSVRGLTTAAGLWMVTGIGLSVGANFYIPAILTTLASMFCLLVLRVTLRRLIRHDSHSVLTIRCHCGATRLRNIREIIEAHTTVRIQRVNFYQNLEEGTVTYRIRLLSKDDVPWGKVVGEVQTLGGLTFISWEEAEVP